jgi:hypothetical protein
MTNTDALKALLATVEADVKYETMGHTLMCQRAFPKPADFDGSREAYLNSNAQRAALVWRNGDLHAAQALHHAKMPPINQWTLDEGPSGCGAHIVVWPDGLSGDLELQHKGYSHCPARAWLIAILKALISEAGK